MEKDKIIILKNNEVAIIASDNCKDAVVAEIVNNNLNFRLYKNLSGEQLAFKVGFSVKNKKNIQIYEFDTEIYLRAKSDIDANAPICIEEDGDTLRIVNLLETDCTSTVDDMVGDVKDISKNFDIAKSRPFLMEDEFSV